MPWSLDWLSQLSARDVGNVPSLQLDANDVVVPFVATEPAVQALPKVVKNKKKCAIVKKSVGFMKKVARMSEHDWKQILHVLKKQERCKKARKGKHHSKEAGTSTFESSKNSNSSVNNDWENWVILHGKSQMVVDDVKAIGKTVGLKFNSDTVNSFNMLTKEGRKEWRAAGGSELVCGSMGDGGGDVGGC